MQFGRVRKQLLSWIACFAILMGSVAPAISHALRQSPVDLLTEVCTSLGAKRLPAGPAADQSAPTIPGGHGMKHCPDCFLHTPSVAPPPAQVFCLCTGLLALELPRLFLVAPLTPHAWVTAQPRAPPQIA